MGAGSDCGREPDERRGSACKKPPRAVAGPGRGDGNHRHGCRCNPSAAHAVDACRPEGSATCNGDDDAGTIEWRRKRSDGAAYANSTGNGGSESADERNAGEYNFSRYKCRRNSDRSESATACAESRNGASAAGVDSRDDEAGAAGRQPASGADQAGDQPGAGEDDSA